MLTWVLGLRALEPIVSRDVSVHSLIEKRNTHAGTGKLNELDTNAIIRDVKRSSDLPMAERLNVHQGVIARLINEVARLRGALQATKKKRARYGGDEDDD